jgi:hypothetical protein
MAERMDERELERALTDVGARLAGPSRDMWPAVRDRIVARRPTPWWSRLAPAAATLAVILAAAFLLTPDLAARAAEVLGLPGVQIFRVPATPPAATASSGTFLGRRVASVAEASRLAGFAVREPAALGAPDEIYVEAGLSRVTLVYRTRPGLPETTLPGIGALIVEFKGSLDAPILGKAIGPGTTLEAVPLSSGNAAYWLAGQPHQFFYRDSAGNIQPDTLRLAGNTLLWDASGITYRLEAQVTRDEAVRLASSFR